MTDLAAPRRLRSVVEPEETPEPPDSDEWSGCETMVGFGLGQGAPWGRWKGQAAKGVDPMWGSVDVCLLQGSNAFDCIVSSCNSMFDSTQSGRSRGV